MPDRNKKDKKQGPLGLCPERLYTKEGVMAACGLGRNSLLAAIRDGKLKRYQMGHRTFFDGAELIAWIKAGKQNETGKESKASK